MIAPVAGIGGGSAPPAPTIPPAPTGLQRVYISTQGDWWDVIALRVYGVKRGNEHLMYRLIEANYTIRELSQFPAGIAVVVPEIAVQTEMPLVPWKKALISP